MSNDEISQEKQSFDELAAALGGHEITDEDGKLAEETTSDERPATQEEKQPEEEAISEKESEVSKPAEELAEEDEDVDAVDDNGKRYIPEKRFKKVYGELKAKERELEELRKQHTVQKPTQNFSTPTPENASKADRLELEILKEKYPQFDPESSQHSPVLDEMGYEILVSNPGMTRLEAARQALNRAKKLGMAEKAVKTEARVVKQQQADSGIANRVLNRKGTQPDLNKMSLEEKEEYLKANGMWD